MTSEVLESDAVTMHETFGQGAAGWMVMYEFVFRGEPFNYIYEAGGPRDTERQARDTATRLNTLYRARQGFLRDIDLGKVRH